MYVLKNCAWLLGPLCIHTHKQSVRSTPTQLATQVSTDRANAQGGEPPLQVQQICEARTAMHTHTLCSLGSMILFH